MPTKYAGSCCSRTYEMAAVNARTLEGIDLSGLPKKQFNGRAL
jgi:hypothetical protein